MSHANRHDLASLITRLRERTAPTFWVDAEYKDALNEALRVWQLISGQWSRTLSVPVNGSNFNTYDVPKQICLLRGVRLDGTALTLTSNPELDYGSPGWEKIAATPTSPTVYWFPKGANRVQVAPYPTSGSLEFFGFQEAISLNSNSDYVEIGDEELTRILGYAQNYLSFKEGTSEFKTTLPELVAMLKAGAEKNARLLTTQMYRRYMQLDREFVQRPTTLTPVVTK